MVDGMEVEKNNVIGKVDVFEVNKRIGIEMGMGKELGRNVWKVVEIDSSKSNGHLLESG